MTYFKAFLFTIPQTGYLRAVSCIKKMDELYTNFCDPSEEFLNEPRSFCYDLAMQFISEAKGKDNNNWYQDESTIKGILLLLFTWNFAARETKN